jgi:outer membrane receptor protein involved in Fe transport
VLREGSLQDKSDLSVATEFGALLPGIDADAGVGASVAGIVSQRFQWTTIHLNAQAELTRDQHADAFLGAIIEGPSTWKMRPVAEVFYENEFGTAQTYSALVGAIWQVNDKLSFDLGVRHALVGGQPVNEIRAGLTFGLPVFFGAHRQ